MFIRSLVIHNKHFPNTDRYPFSLRVFQETDQLKFRGRITFFVGENGSGKSTLLEAMARKYGLTVWGGEKTHIVHSNPYETRLYNFLGLDASGKSEGIRKGFLFRAENFFNYASYLDDLIQVDPDILQYYGGASLNVQSHGESFISFLASRCRIEGIYLLDEPEAALSPSNQLALVEVLHGLVQEETNQFIISTHSPIILSCPGAQILSFDHVPIQEIRYEETRSFQFYKGFMEDREKYLKRLRGFQRDAGKDE
jgi:predicted ATPase